MFLAILVAPAPPDGRAVAQQASTATWGGVGGTWRNSFARTSQAGTRIPVTDVPNPEAQARTQKGAPRYDAVVATCFEAANMNRHGPPETFDPADLPEVRNIPEKYRPLGPHGRLPGRPGRLMHYGIAVNTDVARPDELASRRDPAKPKRRGSSPRTGRSTPRPATSRRRPMRTAATSAGSSRAKSCSPSSSRAG